MASPRRPVIQVWSPPGWTRWVAIVLMLPAFIFLVAAYVPGQIKARLKHPFLVAIKTWALAHLIANGDLASIILFGSFLAYAVYDRITLKRRQATGLVTVAASGPPRNDLIAVVLGAVLYVRVPGLAAPAADRQRALARARKMAAFRPVFCTAKLPIFLP